LKEGDGALTPDDHKIYIKNLYFGGRGYFFPFKNFVFEQANETDNHLAFILSVNGTFSGV